MIALKSYRDPGITSGFESIKGSSTFIVWVLLLFSNLQKGEMESKGCEVIFFPNPILKASVLRCTSTSISMLLIPQ